MTLRMTGQLQIVLAQMSFQSHTRTVHRPEPGCRRHMRRSIQALISACLQSRCVARSVQDCRVQANSVIVTRMPDVYIGAVLPERLRLYHVLCWVTMSRFN